MNIDRNSDGFYSIYCSYQDAPLRAFVVEGETEAIARQRYMDEFANQYAQAESMTAMSIARENDAV